MFLNLILEFQMSIITCFKQRKTLEILHIIEECTYIHLYYEIIEFVSEGDPGIFKEMS